jgi:dienelactone hydrolase
VSTCLSLLASSLFFVMTAVLGAAAPLEDPARDVLVPKGWWTMAAVDSRGRRPFRPDAVFARYLLDPDSPPPSTGQQLMGERGKPASWSFREANEDGRVEAGAAWAYASLEVPEARVMLARLQSASTLFVNGDGFVGDVYRYGWQGVPVVLKPGRNDIYVTGIRGAFQFELIEPEAELIMDAYDRTSPHLVAGSDQAGPLGLLLMNATDRPLKPLIKLAGDGLFLDVDVPLGVLQPLEVTKVSLPQPLVEGARVSADVDEVVRVVETVAAGAEEARAHVPLGVVEDGPGRRETFVSRIDGSVQFFGLLPPADLEGEVLKGEPSLVLSLHGAGVDALGQVKSYSRRPGVWIAAPTNRRPFGFDWQDWGRQDAYEVRDHVLADRGVDSRRVQVTGHSMGGHGAWHLAANDTDGFSAVAPSAGWCSFDTYGGRPAGALSSLWQAADAPSRTLDFVDGLVQVPAFVLHGTKDDNVPPSEAEAMIAALTSAGNAPRMHMQQGAGHWWDGDAAPGADCVDWPGIFELFRDHPQVEMSPELNWVAAGPGVDSRHHELEVQQVLTPEEPFRMQARLESPMFRVKTDNVQLMAVHASDRLAGFTLEVDGQRLAEIPSREGAPLWFVRDAQGGWKASDPPVSGEKHAHRMGPFKKAFDRGFIFVIGTAGSEKENAQLLARARYDGQVWWYRGNGRAPLITDEEYLAGERAPGNVILYGNAETNAAWSSLLEEDFPLQVVRGQVKLGDHVWEGDELAAVFVSPRRDDPEGLVGVFADTGAGGTRLGYMLAPFVSGVGYPDYAVFGPDVLTQGDEGVFAAGWWNNHWGLSSPPRHLKAGR